LWSFFGGKTRGNLAWVAVALAVALGAAVVASFILPKSPPPSTPPPTSTSPEWKVVEVLKHDTPVYVYNAHTSFIENIYAMRHDSGYDKNSWLGQYVGNPNIVFDTASESAPTVTVPYEIPFDFVVAVRADAENDNNKFGNPAPLAYATKENMKVEFSMTGFFEYLENTTDLMEFIFENQNYGQTTGYLRVNCIFDNNGNGWTVPAGSSLNYNLKYWLWG
jgi:hypothetical protein